MGLSRFIYCKIEAVNESSSPSAKCFTWVRAIPDMRQGEELIEKEEKDLGVLLVDIKVDMSQRAGAPLP